MDLKTPNLEQKQHREIKFNKTETKPFGLCSNCYKRNKCNVTTQTNAVVLFCVYR